MSDYNEMIGPRRLEYIKEIESYMGGVDSPEKHAEWCVSVGRQLGKTCKLVDSLPSEGKFAILVHVSPYGEYLKKLIRERRPDIDIKNIHFVTYWNERYKNQMRGLSKIPIFVDNCVLDLIQMDFVKKLNKGKNYNEGIYID